MSELCESCGRPIADHADEWGRWESCVESIMDTLAFHEARPDLFPEDAHDHGSPR